MTSVQSILDKPLAQLTEDDISQLTREDCRKFLKDKGMRRPSWNKSQAIQQVISLKALLEGGDDDGSGARATLRKIVVSAVAAADENSLRAKSNSGDSGKELSAATNAAESAEEIVPYRRRDPTELLHPLDTPSSPKETEKSAASPSSGAAEDVVGQMTIFYCGQVNVYEGVSPDKAQSIMQLAAGPVPLVPDDLANGTNPVLSFHRQEQAVNDKLGPSYPVAATPSHSTQAEKITEFYQHYLGKGSIPRDLDAEGQLNRKVLLQKYLEKRKDRGRFKVRKDVGSVSSNLEIYLNHQARMPISNGLLRKSSNRISPPQPGEAQGTNLVSLSVDLNEEVAPGISCDDLS